MVDKYKHVFFIFIPMMLKSAVTYLPVFCLRDIKPLVALLLINYTPQGLRLDVWILKRYAEKASSG